MCYIVLQVFLDIVYKHFLVFIHFRYHTSIIFIFSYHEIINLHTYGLTLLCICVHPNQPFFTVVS